MSATPNQDPIEELLNKYNEVGFATRRDIDPAIPAIRALQARCEELEDSNIFMQKEFRAKLARLIEAGNKMADSLEEVSNLRDYQWLDLAQETECRSNAQSWRKAIAE